MAQPTVAPKFPFTDSNGRRYRTYKNTRQRVVKVYEPRPDNYKAPLTVRDKKQELIAAYFGDPKKGDFIPGNKGSGTVYNGENGFM